MDSNRNKQIWLENYCLSLQAQERELLSKLLFILFFLQDRVSQAGVCVLGYLFALLVCIFVLPLPCLLIVSRALTQTVEKLQAT